MIATEKGWNLYVGGNGGFTPRHADLLAEDLDTEDLVRTIDRFLMFYIRTADRLQRTAPWLEASRAASTTCARRPGRQPRHLRATSTPRWPGTSTATPTSGRRRSTTRRSSAFVSFVNAPDTGPDLAYVVERGQPRPATADERRAVLVAGPTPGGAVDEAVSRYDRLGPRARGRGARRRPAGRACSRSATAG